MLGRIRLPSPAIVIALAAVVFAAAGVAGAASSGSTKVRTANLRARYTQCTPLYASTKYNCTGPASTTTAHCKKGEHATGGGYGKKNGTGPSLIESRPSPVSGTPTGWTVSTSGSFAGSNGPARADDLYPIYVVCQKG